MIEELEIIGVGGIRHATLKLKGDFIAITGESGAGKSSLVRALEFLSGRRATPNYIHSLEDACEVKAVVTSDVIDALPEKYQPQEGTLVAGRQFSRNGRGKASLQEQTVPLSLLVLAMEKNVVIQSQFAQLGLLDAQKQLEAVDSCGGEELKKTAEALEKTFSEALSAEKKSVAIKKRRKESEERLDAAPEIIRKIKRLELEPDSEKKWEDELAELDKSEAQARALRMTAEKLEGSDGALLEQLERAAQTLRNIAFRDEDRMQSAAENALSSVRALSNLVAEESRAAVSQSDAEAEREETEKKLGALRKIKRTLNIASAEALLEYAKEAEEELKWLSESGKELEELEETSRLLRRETSRLAVELRTLRKASAEKLAEKVNEHLSGLGMGYAKFNAEIEPLDRVRSNGAENVSFTLALQEQQPLPVGKNASGGELSRILIALQLSVGDDKLPGTLVFDEVEAGLGGKTALAAGYKLRRLAKRCRTVLITHQASIAAMADQHFVVTRDGDDANIREVTGEARTREIARMLSGDENSAEALEHARSLLENGGE